MTRAGSALALVVAALAAACTPAGWNGSIEDLLKSQPERFATVMADPVRHRVQVIYTQIDRDSNNRPSFHSYQYRVDADEYFYPASTVKLPVAAIAFELLESLDIPGLDRDTPMFTEAAAEFHEEVAVDPASPTGLPSVGQYVKEILVVSDNDAFNRLYELLGRTPLNAAMREKGYEGVRIIHRLESPLDLEQNGWTNPVRFESAGSVVYRQADRRSGDLSLGDPVLLGMGEIVNGEKVDRPKDFAEKNAYPLQALHDTVKALVFPDHVPPASRFDISADDRRFLLRYMSAYASEADIGRFPDGSYYPEGYVKFLLYGGTEPEIPDNLRVFNKVGDAYGFLTDAAYVADFEAGVEFLLAATVYTNANGVFNDNEYEYDDIGLPFLRDLGRAVYEIELARPREHRPNLDSLAGLHQAAP